MNRTAELSRNHEDRATRILDRITDAFFALDSDWRFTYVNPKAEKVLDRPHGELIGQVIWEAYPGLLGTEFESCYRKAAETQATESLTAYYPDHDRWYTVHVYPAPDGLTLYFRDISSERGAETERAKLLEDSERQRRIYETALSNTADFNYIFDPQGRFTYVNAALLTMLGKSADEVVGRTFLDLGYPVEMAARLQQQIEQVLATRQPLRDHAKLGSDPAGREFEYIFVPVFDREGAVTAVAGSTRDITDHKRAEQDLRLSQERYRQSATEAASAAEANAKFRVFFEQGTQFAGVLTLEGTMTEANELSVEACGFSRESVIGKPFWEGPWWSPSAELVAKIHRAFSQAASGEIFRAETNYFISEGASRIVDLVLAPVRDASGEIQFVAATGTDITERKIAENSARENEARFRNMADSAPVLIWETGEHGVVFVNQHYLAFFGRPIEELVGMGWARYLHPDDADTYVRIYRDAYARRVRFEAQARFLRHDGEYRWMLTSGFPNYAVNGAFLGLIGSSADVSDLKYAEETLRGFAADLARADQQKDEFLALLSHELRNPLAPLQNGLQIMRLSPNDSDAVAQSRDMMERQLRHMVRLIDDLLDISRIAQNKMTLRRSRAALKEIIESALETARPIIAASSHELTVEMPTEAVFIDADVTRLAQVIANLLINAAKYTPPKGKIWLTVEKQGNEVAIAVKDTGIGIPGDALTSIFNMFSQVDRSIERTAGGLGIGLALVKGLVGLHGGTVVATSEGHNEGSTFTVRLPVRAGPRPAKTADRVEPQARAPKRRILVVDDNRDSALSMASLLRLRGSETAVAHDGLAAVKMAEEFMPEVILMDIGMPELNGYDATRRIRAHAWGEKMIIVALTGWGQDNDRADSREAGCNGHLVKPVRLADLEVLLSQLAPVVPNSTAKTGTESPATEAQQKPASASQVSAGKPAPAK